MVVSHPSIKPLAEVRMDRENENMVRPSLLITSAIEVDNTIVSFGDYSFDRKSKAVVRRKTKKSGETVVWTSQGENPEQRAIHSASTLGAFVAMNLGAVDDVCREIEYLRTQVSELQISLQKATEECATIANKFEQKKTKQYVVIVVNEELKKQVESLQSDLVVSKLLRLNMELFLKEALSANEKGLIIRKSFYDLMG